jgi:hypothetical protein
MFPRLLDWKNFTRSEVMKSRVFSFITWGIVFCFCPVAVYALEAMPERITFLAEGRTYPNKPVTARCTVMSQGLLPEERVTITEANNKSLAQEESMKLVQVEGGKRIYEYTINPLAVGDYQFDCHVYFNTDEYEMVAKRFSHLNVAETKDSPGKSTANLRAPLYVRVTENQVITSSMAFDSLEKEALIRSIRGKGASNLRHEELLKKSVEELETINGGLLPKEKQVGDASSSKGAISINVNPERPQNIPLIRLWPADKMYPKKPVRLYCAVRSEAMLPEEKVTITKEVDNNVVVLEEAMNIVEVKQGERIYEYTAKPLPTGDYKFICNVHYVSEEYKNVVIYNQKDKVKAKDKKNGQYDIDVIRTLYVMVRDDEVISAGWNFDYMEKDKLIRHIQEKELTDNTYTQLLKKSIQELESMLGESLPKYKAVGPSRPK